MSSSMFLLQLVGKKSHVEMQVHPILIWVSVLSVIVIHVVLLSMVSRFVMPADLL